MSEEAKAHQLAGQMGRPPYEPTEEAREIVAAMAFTGFTHARIAANLKMSETTLRKYFEYELHAGADNMIADVVRSLASKALAGDTTACIWITKARAGWREQPQKLEVSADAEVRLSRERKEELIERVLGIIAAAKRG